MIYTVILEMRRKEGALLRAIGLVERRGFALCSVSAMPGPGDSEMQMVLQIEANSRSPETLTRQLAKQIDVCEVAWWSGPARAAAPAEKASRIPAPATDRELGGAIPATIPI